jgi:hypothetical protein
MDDNFENLKLSSEFLELISILEWSSLSERFYLDEKRISDSNIKYFCEIIQVSKTIVI